MTNKSDMLIYENQCYQEGYKFVAGVDEVGRGCIAGPLVAAMVILPKDYFNNKIKDSKLLSAAQRESLYHEIISQAISYEIFLINPKQVDELNPKQASIYAMEQCYHHIEVKPDVVLVDYEKLKLDTKTISITKGDQKSQSIAAASILAKVYRDNLMIEASKNYHSDYDFINNKGYLTKKHQEALIKHGPIKNFHRFSYKNIKELLK